MNGDTPVHPGGAETDEETRRTLDERLETIERDGQDAEEWTPELKARLIRKLQTLVPK